MWVRVGGADGDGQARPGNGNQPTNTVGMDAMPPPP